MLLKCKLVYMISKLSAAEFALCLFAVLIQDFVPGPFLDKYKDRFLDVIVSSAIRTRLEMDKVVPAALSFEMNNTSNEQATANLFLHLHAHALSDGIHKLCDAMISATGYPNMNNLGEDMKNDKGLPPYSEFTLHTQLHVSLYIPIVRYQPHTSYCNFSSGCQ